MNSALGTFKQDYQEHSVNIYLESIGLDLFQNKLVDFVHFRQFRFKFPGSLSL